MYEIIKFFLKKPKKTQKNPILVGFFKWFFLGGFFWVGISFAHPEFKSSFNYSFIVPSCTYNVMHKYTHLQPLSIHANYVE